MGKGKPHHGYRCAAKIRAPRIVKVGTDFSGMDAGAEACKKLKIKHKNIKFQHTLKFSCDNSPHCRKLIKLLHKPEVLHDDVLERDSEEAVDAYLWGAPCQTYSSAGKGKGVKDPRGKLIKQGIKHIVKHRPRLSIMENVRGLVSKKHKPVLKGCMKALRHAGYKVKARLLNSKSYGIPHNRVRLYMVAIRGDSACREFKWPKPTSSHGSVKLSSFLDPLTSSDKPGRLPKLQRSKDCAKAAYRKALSCGIDPMKTPVAVDIDCSSKFRTFGIDEVKTITRSRGGSGGPWISTRGRRTTLNELFRLQGFNPSDFATFPEAGVTESQMGAMLGNAMTLPVIASVMAEGLWSAGLVAEKHCFESDV